MSPAQDDPRPSGASRARAQAGGGRPRRHSSSASPAAASPRADWRSTSRCSCSAR
ncbi:hypothetical protein NQP46_23250 [Streptomyces albus]|nr:hypothetical protein NQP46_23250 [Streptomyces albus]